MKKLLVMMMALMLVLSLAACGQQAATTDTASDWDYIQGQGCSDHWCYQLSPHELLRRQWRVDRI